MAHIRTAMRKPTMLMILESGAEPYEPEALMVVFLVNREPQYQSTTTYSCWVPWMTQAR